MICGNLQISQAIPEDLPMLMDILRTSSIAQYVNRQEKVTKEDVEMLADKVEEEMPKIAARLEDDFSNHPIWKATVNNTIVGYIAGHVEQKRNVIGHWYVLPIYQGQGIGSSLLTKALTYFCDDKETVADVVRYNSETISKYEKRGFKKDKEFEQPLDDKRSIPMVWMKKPANYSK